MKKSINSFKAKVIQSRSVIKGGHTIDPKKVTRLCLEA